MPNQFQFAEAYTELTLRGRSKFHADIRGVTASLKTLQGHFDGVARHARRMLLVGGGALAAMVKLASDAAETQSKFNAVFRENAKSVREWTRELGAAVGRSKFAIESTMASFQAFFVGMDFGSKQAIDLSKKMQALAIDFASFHNLSDAEASKRFISALSGSSEVLDMFGINIKQAALQQELYRMGVNKSVMAANEQEKTMARVNVIFRAMAQQGAIGDAARTSGQLANQLRMLKDRLIEVSVEIGNAFIPMVQRAVSALAEMLKGMQNMDAATKESIVRWTLFVGAFAGFLAIAPNVLRMITGIVTALGVLGMSGGAIALATGGVGALIFALGGLGAAFLAASAKGEGLGEFLRNLAEDILGVGKHVNSLKEDLKALEALRTKRKEEPAPGPQPAVDSPEGKAAELEERYNKARSALIAARKKRKEEETSVVSDPLHKWAESHIIGGAPGEPSTAPTEPRKWEDKPFLEKLFGPPPGQREPAEIIIGAPSTKQTHDNLKRERKAQRVFDELRVEVQEARLAEFRADQTKGAEVKTRAAAEKQVKPLIEGILEALAPGLAFQVRTAKPKESPVGPAVAERLGKELMALLFPKLTDAEQQQKTSEARTKEAQQAGWDWETETRKRLKGEQLAELRKPAQPPERDVQRMGMADVNAFMQRQVTKTEDKKAHKLLEDGNNQRKEVLQAIKEKGIGWA